MIAKSFLHVVVLLAFALKSQGLNAATSEDPDRIPSARLNALARDLEKGNRGSLEIFWREVDRKAPLVEAIGTDQRHRFVTFLWRGSNDTTRVTMIGGLPSPNLLKPLRRLADTDLWYLTEIHSTEARFQYVFQINGPEAVPMQLAAIMRVVNENSPRTDPLNPHEYARWSYIELPDAPRQPWLVKRSDVPSGSKTNEAFKSRILNAEYSLSIYTPPGYEQDARRCWLLIAFDGGFNMEEVTLDNLLAAGKIPPLVVVGVRNLSSQTRQRDLDCSDEFARFLAEEIVPWARKTYRVYNDPDHTIVGGTSLGGKMAVYCVLKHSEVFGKVLSQSGSFLTGVRQESPTPLWEGEAPGLLAVQFLKNPRLPLEFYMDVGRYETTLPFSHLLETRRLRDVLEAKGYRVTYSEFVGGHNEVCWRGSFADGIMALTAKQ